jgi:Ohr subfamily peroxiredoxin
VDVTLTPPKESGGSGTGTNPEQLFAVGYAGCYLGALRFVGRTEKKPIPDDATITAHVGIGKRDDGEGFGLAITLEGNIPGMSKEDAEALMEKAHKVCPYSHSIRGNVVVTTRAV